MSILDHFWKILLAVLIFGAGFFLWKRQQSQKNFNLQLDTLAEFLQPENSNYAKNPKPVYAHYYELMGKLAEIKAWQATQKDPLLMDDLIDEALEKTDYSDFVQDLVGQAVKPDFELCEKLGIFDESADNRFLLESGKPPVIQRGPYRKEKLLIGHLVSPNIAREAMNHYANFSFMPESVWAMQNDLISSAARTKAQQLSNAGVIRKATFQEITAAYSAVSSR